MINCCTGKCQMILREILKKSQIHLGTAKVLLFIYDLNGDRKDSPTLTQSIMLIKKFVWSILSNALPIRSIMITSNWALAAKASWINEGGKSIGWLIWIDQI